MSRCKHCGATAIPLRKVCDYCGTPAEQGFGYPVPVEGSETKPGVASDFERLLAHPDLATILNNGPSVEPPSKRNDGAPKLIFVLVVFALIFWKSGAFNSAHGAMPAAPILFLAVVAFSMLRRRSRQRAFPGTQLESLPVRILEVQSEERWPRRGWVKVLLALQSGERRLLRYRASGDETWAARAMGAAHIKANVLVEFHELKI